MCVYLFQYMFQNQEAEAFPATGCEEQWVCAEVEGNRSYGNIF